MSDTKRVRVTFHGGAGEVTGANFLLETIDEQKPLRVLVDCGLFQGSHICEPQNHEPFPYDPASIDYLFITHSHIDHTGRIPKLVKDGFKGVIYSTSPVRDIAEVMLIDSMNLLEKFDESGKKLGVLYEEKDVHAAMGLWETKDYHEPFSLGDESLSVEFKNAGHTLGSSVIVFTYNRKKIVFTGDLGNSPAPLLRDAEAVADATYMIVESVYGDRNHEGRDTRRQLLEQAIEDTMLRRGVLMIPAFSLERTQELLYEIERLMEQGRIPLVPVYVDSPLAIKITDVYKKYASYFNEDVRYIINSGNEVFHFPQLHFTMKTDESKAINDVMPPKIIIAGSGMSNGGRIVHHERRYLGDPRNTLLLAGYQAVGTLGRRLQDGEKNVTIFGEPVSVRAKVLSVHGYSAHMDSEHLLQYVATSGDTLKRVFVAMGEPKSSLFLVQRIRDYLGIHAVAPDAGESFEIEV